MSKLLLLRIKFVKYFDDDVENRDVKRKSENRKFKYQKKNVNVKNISKSLFQRYSQRDKLKMLNDFNYNQRDMNKKYNYL